MAGTAAEVAEMAVEEAIEAGLVTREAVQKGGVRPAYNFIPYEDVHYSYLQIDEEVDEGDRKERLRNKFYFNVKGKHYRYRARMMDVEFLDEMFIEHLDDRYLGAVVKTIETEE